MTMSPISINRAMEIAHNQGIVPGRVNGTELVQFTKGDNSRITPISWDEFTATLEKRGLAIYATGAWMKLMKKKE